PARLAFHVREDEAGGKTRARVLAPPRRALLSVLGGALLAVVGGELVARVGCGKRLAGLARGDELDVRGRSHRHGHKLARLPRAEPLGERVSIRRWPAQQITLRALHAQLDRYREVLRPLDALRNHARAK